MKSLGTPSTLAKSASEDSSNCAQVRIIGVDWDNPDHPVCHVQGDGFVMENLRITTQV